MIIAIPAGIIARYQYKWIHHHQWIVYIAAFILAIAGFLADIEPIIEGELALGIWALVMVAGAISPLNPYGKALRGIRKELSLIGFILITPHALHYLLAWDLEWFGIIAFAIMIPLTIISIDPIRRMMTQKTWKKIQRFAYVVYLSVALHLALVGEPAFTIFFIFYVGLRLRYEYNKRHKQKPLPKTVT